LELNGGLPPKLLQKSKFFLTDLRRRC
jgi:hypothetical protein